MNPPIPRPYEGSSQTIEYVQWFAGEMEHKLAKNRHKGDREGWINDHPKRLLERLNQETEELAQAIFLGDYDQIIAEAADVGNFAMMIADIARTLQSVKGPGEFSEPKIHADLALREKMDAEASRKSETVRPAAWWRRLLNLHRKSDTVALL